MKPDNTMNPTEASATIGFLPQTVPTTAAAISRADSNSAPATISAPPAPSNDPLAIIQRDRAESLKRKQRTDSFLHRLDEAQLNKVLSWLDEEEDIGVVYHHITAPAPEGLGLEVGLSTVRRLRAQVTATHANYRATEILDTIIDMEAASDPTQSTAAAQSERIQSAIFQLLHQKAFELVRTEPGSIELRDILNTIEKLSALDLKRQKIALDREKMLRHHQRASASPLPRRHHVELKVVPASEPAQTHNSHASHISHSSHTSPQLQIIAPLPEVVL
jgi:hypothetical protein